MSLKKVTIEYDDDLFIFSYKETKSTGSINYGLRLKEQHCYNCNKPLEKNNLDWNLVDKARDLRLMSYEKNLAKKKRYFKVKAVSLGSMDEEVLMCKFCSKHPELREQVRQISKHIKEK